MPWSRRIRRLLVCRPACSCSGPPSAPRPASSLVDLVAPSWSRPAGLAGQKLGQGGPIAAGPLAPRPPRFGAIKYARMRAPYGRRPVAGLGVGVSTRSDGPWSRATFSRMCTGRFSSELDAPVTFILLRHGRNAAAGGGRTSQGGPRAARTCRSASRWTAYGHMTPRLMSNTAALMDWLLDGRSLVRQLLTAPSHRGRPVPVRICGGHPHSAGEANMRMEPAPSC